MIDSKEASAALADIDDIVQRVKQSQLYELASLAALWWGVLVFAGNLITWLWPYYARYAWPAVDILGVGGLIAIRILSPPHSLPGNRIWLTKDWLALLRLSRLRERPTRPGRGESLVPSAAGEGSRHTGSFSQGAAFDIRLVLVFALFFAFGNICTSVLGHFGPRELGAFWPVYFMLFYTLAGLWFGTAFVAIGLGIIALTLIGFFFIGEAFPLWMAFVNGGGLILGGLWMRRI